MGVNVANTSIVEDHATAGNESCIELHMGLTIPYEETPEYRFLLEKGEWARVAEKLAERNPSQAELIKLFLEAAARRKASESAHRLTSIAAIA